ncbi:MAG: sulfur oxidation protein SoxY [Betaproteobacteria bacterium]|nr:sulfur oxidation protein SoxY [Pseudomonadota bacterium]NBP36137.1 sulfur oxidation protein SoxY [Betaproteobacteria bacterium]HAB46998.1 sulfur oxidation protein SoxY [Lautropia sp.]NBP39332.1 sulfur oxidation protein SoxY [Betaproteobacteria bacterium]NBQ10239.1 sulfur oxidation protein SoxY [Betaproteobacteria bacterium]
MKQRRRDLLAAAAALIAAPWHDATAKASAAAETIARITEGKPLSPGRIYMELAPLVENGNSVAVKFGVQSPMTDADHVRAIHLVSEGNPLPNIVSCHFTVLSGKAEVMTRVRLAESQRVWAIAELSDGSFWRTHADTVVTLSACTEMI